MKTLVALIACFVAALTCLAAADSQNVLVCATVPNIFSLDTSATSVAFAFQEADYDAERVASKSVTGAHNLLVRSNRPWVVSFKSTTDAFRFTPSRGDADPGKPATALAVRAGAGTFAAVTTSDQVLRAGRPGPVQAAGNTFPVDYRLTSDLHTDKPGLYRLTVTYTVTTP